MQLVEELTHDFPPQVYEDIILGKFASRMRRYQRQWYGHRPYNFGDFGEVHDDIDFKQLVMIYEKVCKHDQSQEIEIMMESQKREQQRRLGAFY